MNGWKKNEKTKETNITSIGIHIRKTLPEERKKEK